MPSDNLALKSNIRVTGVTYLCILRIPTVPFVVSTVNINNKNAHAYAIY